MVSVVILTLNEESNIADCLESVAWSDDVVVFDSYSTDHTVEIASKAGARVYQREFDDYAAQRNAALSTVSYRNNWVLMVDADERWPRDMLTEIREVIDEDKDGSVSVCLFRRKDIVLGRWLKHSNGYPTWAARLLRLSHVSVKRQVNEEYHATGRKVFMKSHFIHHPFSKGIANWLERHNRYSTMEAKALLEEGRPWPQLRMLASRDPTVRRKCLKQLAYHLPCRPLLVFCYLYFFRLGFLDGMAGLTYCRLRAMYEYTIDLKVGELRRNERTGHVVSE
jgi:glycosyltransferase involved in cell wall biosynthesis